MRITSILLLSFCFANAARANVYATNVRLNNGTTDVVLPPGGSIRVSYILNEPATLGVTVNVTSGGTILRTLTLAYPNPGTLTGSNSVAWDGRDNNSNAVSGGNFTISVTASTSHSVWEQISDDLATGTAASGPTAIAVNQNTNSLYYGRIFVANAFEGANPGTYISDRIGILKMNADASYASEGGYSTGGWPWSGNYASPWKMEVSDDDRVYVNDFTAGGVVLSFDQAIATNSLRLVMGTNNYPNSAVRLSGLAITGSGSGSQLWMSDTNSQGGVGIRRWNLTGAGVVATNDLGATVASAPSLAPFDLALSGTNKIYTVQFLTNGYLGPGCAWGFGTTSGFNPAETNLDWGSCLAYNSLQGPYGIAVASNYVAVAFLGTTLPGSITPGDGGGLVVLTNTFTSNGIFVTNAVPAFSAPVSGEHYHTDAAWDNVGNLYTADGWDGIWRVYSPPGTNSATTVALAQVVADQVSSPLLSAPSYSNGLFSFTLNGASNASYVI